MKGQQAFGEVTNALMRKHNPYRSGLTVDYDLFMNIQKQLENLLAEAARQSTMAQETYKEQVQVLEARTQELEQLGQRYQKNLQSTKVCRIWVSCRAFIAYKYTLGLPGRAAITNSLLSVLTAKPSVSEKARRRRRIVWGADMAPENTFSLYNQFFHQ